jgi:hypothetical protein
VLRGIVFVENSRGALDTARMVCPIKLERHRVRGSETGEGRCRLTSRDQHQVFAQFTCTGTYGVGCQGRFTLTGGTGSFKGTLAPRRPGTIRRGSVAKIPMT